MNSDLTQPLRALDRIAMLLVGSDRALVMSVERRVAGALTILSLVFLTAMALFDWSISAGAAVALILGWVATYVAFFSRLGDRADRYFGA